MKKSGRGKAKFHDVRALIRMICPTETHGIIEKRELLSIGWKSGRNNWKGLTATTAGTTATPLLPSQNRPHSATPLPYFYF
ncbi:hypothetical protein SLA2020_040000 [Shorea laevis]